MFFKNKYTTPEIDVSIKEKGFWVYNYISFKELLMTVQRDYLAILSKINIFFGIITIVLWIWAFLSWSFWFLFSFLAFVYGIIFVILLFKLIARSFYYLYISNVVYTQKGIILWSKLYLYKDDKNLENKLLEYEEMFDEFLSRPSQLEQVILQKRAEVLERTAKTGKKALDVMENFDLWNSEWGVKLAMIAMLSYGIYTALLYAFYYIWYFFWYVMFFFVSLFLKIILFFRKNIEIKIKQKIEKIDESFSKMQKIDSLLSQKISDFGEGEIGNIAKFVETNFANFYSEILLVLQQRKNLLKTIKDSDYKNFIDFVLLEKYIKNSFNKPVTEMTKMLNRFEKKLAHQIELLKRIQTNQAEFSANLTKKELILEYQLEVLKNNKRKLEKIRI